LHGTSLVGVLNEIAIVPPSRTAPEGTILAY